MNLVLLIQPEIRTATSYLTYLRLLFCSVLSSNSEFNYIFSSNAKYERYRLLLFPFGTTPIISVKKVRFPCFIKPKNSFKPCSEFRRSSKLDIAFFVSSNSRAYCYCASALLAFLRIACLMETAFSGVHSLKLKFFLNLLLHK